jgi:hypothetical protein
MSKDTELFWQIQENKLESLRSRDLVAELAAYATDFLGKDMENYAVNIIPEWFIPWPVLYAFGEKGCYYFYHDLNTGLVTANYVESKNLPRQAELLREDAVRLSGEPERPVWDEYRSEF